MSDAAYGDAELAALYDLVYADYDADVPLYENFAARASGPVLELCVGSGRVALRLARRGYEVTGVDASPHMLARLRARLDDDTSQRIRVEEGDIRSFDLGRRFGMVFCALDSFEQLLSVDDASAALRRVASHLEPGGIFVAELRTLRSVDWSGEPSPLHAEWTRTDPETGDLVTKFSSIAASAATQTTTTSLIFDRIPAGGGPLRRRVLDVTLRVFGRFEIELLLERAGLRLAQLYGGVDLSPFTPDSDTMLIVAGGKDT